MTVDEYYSRIRRIPILLERESVDGDAWLGRTSAGIPVRIDKPDRHDDEAREALLAFYEQFYGVTQH